MQYHDESTPPLPTTNSSSTHPRPKRSQSAHARYSMPSRVNGHIIPISANAPPPPPPAPIIAPPPPPKSAVNMAPNLCRNINHRYSMPAKIPQSTTESATPRPPRASNYKARGHSSPSTVSSPPSRKRGNTTPHRVTGSGHHTPPHPPPRSSRHHHRPNHNQNQNQRKSRPPKRSKSTRRRATSSKTHQGHQQKAIHGASRSSDSRSDPNYNINTKRERSQSQKQRVRFLYDHQHHDHHDIHHHHDNLDHHDGNALKGLIGGHQYVAVLNSNNTNNHLQSNHGHNNITMTPTITHISQYNNFNHYNVTHLPQTAVSAPPPHRNHNTNNNNNTNHNHNENEPNSNHSNVNVNKTGIGMVPRVPLSDRWDGDHGDCGDHGNHHSDHLDDDHHGDHNLNQIQTVAIERGQEVSSPSSTSNRLQIVRQSRGLSKSKHPLDYNEAEHSIHSLSSIDPRLQHHHLNNARSQRQRSSDPNIRSMSRSPSLPPLTEHRSNNGINRIHRAQSGGSTTMMLRERVNPRRRGRRRSKLKVIRDQRKGSDPQGMKERKLSRDRVGAKSMGNLIKSRSTSNRRRGRRGRGRRRRRKGDRESAESERDTDHGGTSPVSPDGANTVSSILSLSKMSKNCHLRFFVEINGIWTYSVLFQSNLCGLELCPIDHDETTGAMVIKCHNAFSQQKVVEGSLLIGIGNEIVLQMDHYLILKKIRLSPRPLKLTFYHRTKQGDLDSDDKQYLCLWLSSDNTMRFKSKAV